MTKENSPFLFRIAQKILEREEELHSIMVVLPNRRGELYLKKYLSELIKEPVLSPSITTIENWVVGLSGLVPISGVDLYFVAYDVYTRTVSKPESFDAFLKWIPSVLQDFNEIDRYQVNANDLYQNLLDAKKLEQWGVEDQPSEMIDSFLTFWKQLGPFYFNLVKHLEKLGLAWQGMAFRKVAHGRKDVLIKLGQQGVKHIIFAGFNAFNRCEIKIVADLLEEGIASIYWDADVHYLDDTIQEAGMFLRSHKQWNYFNKREFSWVENSLNRNKEVHTYGVSGAIEQAKKVGEILNNLNVESAGKIAVVLADEHLLIPVLNAIPKHFKQFNVTMGVAIAQIAVSHLVQDYLTVCKRLKSNLNRGIYFKDFISLIDQKAFTPFISVTHKLKVFEYIRVQNLAFITHEDVKEMEKMLQCNLEVVSMVYQHEDVLEAILAIEFILQKFASSTIQSKIEKEAVYQLALILNQLKNNILNYPFANDFEIVTDLFRQLLVDIQLTFFGEPLQGIQVMGLLETRTLEFDTIIMTSVNEGILPSGKSQNSFIPFDIRRYFGLPVHTEKDAVYAYHFFRLLQRTKQAHFIYNTATSGLGAGEASRFINQIEAELKGVKYHTHSEGITIKAASLNQLKVIKKSDQLISDLREYLQKGLSPTALELYIRNPMAFYKSRVLGINEEDSVEEVVGYDTLGTVVHAVLEEFYKSFIGGFPGEEDFKQMHTKLDSELSMQFKKHYGLGRLTEGKNLLIFQVAQKMVKRFLKWDEINAKKHQEKGKSIKILYLEKFVERELYIDKLGFAIKLRGVIDRLEQVGNTIRIIDYKTGSVQPVDLKFRHWEDVVDSEKKKGKALQLLMYGYMLNEKEHEVNSGIISLKNQRNGLMFCMQYPAKGNHAETVIFTDETIKEIENALVLKVCEMMDQSIDIQDYDLSSFADRSV